MSYYIMHQTVVCHTSVYLFQGWKEDGKNLCVKTQKYVSTASQALQAALWADLSILGNIVVGKVIN